MVNIGSAPGSSNVAKVTVLPDHPKTMVIIGADQGPGTADGPSRKVDVYEDVLVHGNAQVGEVSCVRTRWPQGVDGIIHEGVDDEVPRIEKIPGDKKLHVIGGGNMLGPERGVVLHDDAEVVRNLEVGGLTELNGGVSVMGAIDATGDVNAGAAGDWHTVRAQNMVYASGTFHIYDRGAGIVCKQCCGYGFDATLPINFAMNVNYAPLMGFPPVVMIMLDAPIVQSAVSVTPWLVAQYDETSPPGILPILTGWAPPPILQETHPYVTIKGIANPAGALPMGPLAQQIEIFFATDDPIIPFIPTPGSPSVDLVFDINVMGYLAR